MSDCIWGPDGACVLCGRLGKGPRYRRMCSVAPPEDASTPGLLSRLTGYGTAVARWLRAGRPVRSDERVAELLTVHCEPCEHFAGESCRKCGCAVGRSKSGWANKLRMATESCPIGLWGADAAYSRPSTLRVAFLVPNLLRGGVEQWLIDLVARLPDHGVSVSAVGHHGGAGTFSSEVACKLSVPVLTTLDEPGTTRIAVASELPAVACSGVDVAVAWSCSPLQLLSARRSTTCIVGVSHGVGDWWMREASSHIDHWAAVSDAARAPVPSEQCTVIPNGIDLARLNVTLSREVLRSEVGLPQAAKVIVSVGRIAKEKRLGLAVQALGRLPSDHWLWLVGDGRDSLPKHDRLIVTPSRSDVGNIYHAADCALLLSQAEGYCLSAVEALASGIPLVATPVGILPQLDLEVGRSVARYLSIDPSPQEVATSVLQSLASHVPSADVRSVIQAGHSAEAMAARWASFLTGVVSSANRST